MVRLAKAVGAFLMGLALFLCVPGGAVKAAEPVKGGTLNVGFFDDTKTLDPVYSVALSERQILFLMFDNLIDIGPDFSLKPSLATSWEYQNGEKRILLHLRTDVKFHDGTDFDADGISIGACCRRRIRRPAANLRRLSTTSKSSTRLRWRSTSSSFSRRYCRY
jgi:ABC-type transport system substrate-binding protein